MKTSGIDASPWREAKKNAKLAAKREKQAATEKKKPPKKENGTSVPPRESQTKENDARVGQNSGKVESPPRSAPVPGDPTASPPKASSSKSSKPVVVFHPNKDTNASLSSRGGIHVSEVHATSSQNSKSRVSFATLVTALLAVVLFAAGLGVVNMYISAPIQVGHVLAPGTVLHKCGFAGFIPGLQTVLSAISPRLDCENEYLIVEDEQVTGYDNDGSVVWMIMGAHHSGKQMCDVENEKDCMRGLHYMDDKHLMVSGTKIAWIETFERGVDVHPWPFEEKPLTRTWKK